MAKIYGLFGAMTGKLADTVMSVRNGEQIARKYQPMVANPSTAKQVEARAKLKLMSQLSAVFAPVIAMRRDGAKSARNVFVKANYNVLSFQNNEATAQLSAITLTNGLLGLPSVFVERSERAIGAVLNSTPSFQGVDRVVYVMFAKGADQKLRYAGSSVASEPGEYNQYPAPLPFTTDEVVIYGYGVRANNDAARTIFGNMTVETAEDMAKLIATRTLLESDVTLTETRAYTLPAAQ